MVCGACLGRILFRFDRQTKKSNLCLLWLINRHVVHEEGKYH